jgi:gamma-aminobutyric acid type B receptor
MRILTLFPPSLSFHALQGNVSFDGADRIGITAFYQIQFAQLQPVALYYPETELLDFTCPSCMTIKWENNVVPIAKRVFKLRFATISRLAFFTITSLAGVGIVLSLMFLAFNLHFRKLK